MTEAAPGLDSRDTPGAGALFIICAPSGAGKTSLVRALVGRVPRLAVSVSHTTRKRRPGEREGRDYHFVERDRFEHMLAENALLEHALVFDHYYGTSQQWVERVLRTRDVILEIDWQGARQIRARAPDAVSIQVLPPSLETLEERLKRRGQDTHETIARRMRDAIEEMTHLAEFDYIVVNDHFERALAELEAIVMAERARTARRLGRSRDLVGRLLGPRGSGILANALAGQSASRMPAERKD